MLKRLRSCWTNYQRNMLVHHIIQLTGMCVLQHELYFRMRSATNNRRGKKKEERRTKKQRKERRGEKGEGRRVRPIYVFFFNRNCNHFTNEFSTLLLRGKKIPRWINRLVFGCQCNVLCALCLVHLVAAENVLLCAGCMWGCVYVVVWSSGWYAC